MIGGQVVLGHRGTDLALIPSLDKLGTIGPYVLSLSKDASASGHELADADADNGGTMRPFFVYILRCSDDSLYTGHTDDLGLRIAQHQLGQLCQYTCRRRPVALAFSCEVPTRIDALERERQIKGWSRAKKEALIRGDFDVLRALSRPSTRGRCATAAQGERLGFPVRP